jgi:hypothetical protein
MSVTTKNKEIISYKSPVNPDSLSETSGFAKRFPTVKARVISILKNDNYARRNYLWLCMVYWAKCGHIKVVVPLEKFNQVNSPETVTRAFREIMKEHREKQLYPFLKFDAVDEMREKRSAEIKNYFGAQK